MSVKIGVLIKYVPDTSTKIELKDGKIDETNIKYVINPYDEFAIEEAVKTKEAWGGETEVVGICLGPKAAQKALRDAFAIGVDRGILIVDEERKASDPNTVSKALASVAKEEGFKLIFAGKQAVDTDTHATAQMIAARLAMPSVSVVSKIEWEGQETALVERDVEGGAKERLKITLPALITANKGLNKMRLASLPMIRRASKKEIKEVELPEVGQAYEVSNWSLPPERGEVKLIEGEPAAQAEELVRILREEEKVI